MHPRVLVVATSRKTRGGITAVIKAHEQGEQWKRYHCHWVQTHRDGPAWRKLAYLLWALVDYMIRLPFYDIVHIHLSLKTTAKRKLPFAKLAKLFRKKLIIHLHCGTQIDNIWNNKYDYLFKNADASILLSNNLKEIVNRHVRAKNLITLYNPCPTPKLSKHISQSNIILFSGTLYKGKGYADLISAFAKIAQNYPEWRIVFAGNGEIENGKKIAQKLGISAQVEFLGWVTGEAKQRVFQEASIFCLPSYAEGFPMAVLDAWAYGLPVVTTPVGGIPDIAKDGDNMLLFNPGDTDNLAKQLERLITDLTLRKHIAEESEKLAHGLFSINTINLQLAEIYRTI